MQKHGQSNANPQATLVPMRLDDAAHPDNGFYLQTRELICQLDQQNGRSADFRSDQLAAALTVQGRANGLQRIDRIALNGDATTLWGMQQPAGARDHFFDRQCSVNTVQALNTPMEQSGKQWLQAMQQFDQHQERQQQTTQQSQAVQQSGPNKQI